MYRHSDITKSAASLKNKRGYRLKDLVEEQAQNSKVYKNKSIKKYQAKLGHPGSIAVNNIGKKN